MSTKKPPLTVAQYIASAVTLSGKSNAQIATDLGYGMERGNFISMLRTGRAKLPLGKVVDFAKSVGIDPIHLLRLVLHEYSPDTLAVLTPFLGSTMTAGEQKVIEVIRAEATDMPVEFSSEELATIQQIAKDARTRAEATQRKGQDITEERWAGRVKNPFEILK